MRQPAGPASAPGGSSATPSSGQRARTRGPPIRCRALRKRTGAAPMRLRCARRAGAPIAARPRRGRVCVRPANPPTWPRSLGSRDGL